MDDGAEMEQTGPADSVADAAQAAARSFGAVRTCGRVNPRPERPAVAFITFHMVNIILSIIRLIITTFTSADYLRPCFSSMLFISIATGQVTSF
ncbi:hypothetical protein KYI92_22180 [Pantoea allii]|uniref:Uncharacterized protein n=1 Tax=Pantoea allii TaxID=574096 RepID=A0ABS6VKN8_9GAMM|nr:hypothetical protein [Pantoea allii]MBW1216225.1 hypothetical protein [Pantoea allii]MBW1259897.1 hypothetical protein [Pantoea allii]MBW1268997.1 hypothetical protein [Pantoea allii]MBW1291078.1 hypothetical protein [Pantoea allii]